MYLSIKRAKKLLQTEAGFTIAVAASEVALLKTKTFGKREKVKLADVSRIITEANKPTPIAIPDGALKIRPFRKSLRNQIRRAHGLPEI